MIGGPELALPKPGSVRLLMRDGLCLLMDASPEQEVEVNGAPPVRGTSLHHGDLISIAGVELVFGHFDEQREPNLEAAIARNPDSREPWLVYADWLQERGDPLGERIAQPQRALDDPHWLEGLDAIEVKWRCGMIERAVFRESLGAWLGTARRQITRLLSLRSAAFLRELVLDLLADEQSLDRPTISARVGTFLEQLPPMPALERLCVGYHLSDDDPPPVIRLRDPRFPRLGSDPVFIWARRGVFEVVGLDGTQSGDRVPAAGTRIAVERSRITLARLGDSTAAAIACSFDEVGGRVLVQVTEGHEQCVEVNGFAWGMSLFLLPGDLLEIFAEVRDSRPPVRLRFALEG